MSHFPKDGKLINGFIQSQGQVLKLSLDVTETHLLEN
jgi:hypothetical protein